MLIYWRVYPVDPWWLKIAWKNQRVAVPLTLRSYEDQRKGSEVKGKGKQNEKGKGRGNVRISDVPHIFVSQIPPNGIFELLLNLLFIAVLKKDPENYPAW